MLAAFTFTMVVYWGGTSFHEVGPFVNLKDCEDTLKDFKVQSSKNLDTRTDFSKCYKTPITK